jgi:hypothetical protein
VKPHHATAEELGGADVSAAAETLAQSHAVMHVMHVMQLNAAKKRKRLFEWRVVCPSPNADRQFCPTSLLRES